MSRARVVLVFAALAALGLAVAYALVTARFAGRLVLPVDDAYAYLTCATRRACGGSPSVTWPVLLAAPGAVTGGHGLVATAYGLSAGLYVATVAGGFAIARRIGGELAGVLAAVATLAIAPFAFATLAGLEVGVTAACWVGALVLFGRRVDRDTPGVGLGLVLVALGLARPEAAIVVVVIAVAGAWGTWSWRGLAAWLAPIAPVAWWWFATLRAEHAPELDALRGDGAPLAYVFAAAWLIGAIRLWTRRTSTLGVLIVVTPVAYLLAARTTPAAAFPVFAITVGAAAARVADTAPAWLGRVRIGAALAGVLGIAALAVPPLRASLAQFAQDASDLERRVAPFRARFSEASLIGTHDPAAVAFHADRPTVALDGDDPAEGPGARFERLERLALAEPRPSHLISGPVALGFDELFGEATAFSSPGPKLARRSWSRGEVRWIEARWDHVPSAERPLTAHARWHVVDRVDLADLADEAAHRWTARSLGAQATVFHRDTTPELALDGGRTIAAEERFEVDVDPARPLRVVLRTGGLRQYPDAEPIAVGAALRVDDRPLAVPAPRGTFVEVELELPAGPAHRTIHVTADRPYRAFHWFVLQPD